MGTEHGMKARVNEKLEELERLAKVPTTDIELILYRFLQDIPSLFESTLRYHLGSRT